MSTLKFFGCCLILPTLLVAGCSPPRPAPGTSEEARQALAEALDGWKAGKNADDLQKTERPLSFADEAFFRGDVLLDYTILSEPRPFGHALRFEATLQVKERSQAAARVQRAAFRVIIHPKRHVTREETAS